MPKKRVFLGAGGAAGPEPAGGVLPLGVNGPGIDPLPGTGTPRGTRDGAKSVPVPPDAVSTVPVPAAAAAAAAARAASCSARSRSRCAMARSGLTSSVVSLSCGGMSSLGIRSPMYCPDGSSYPDATAKPSWSQITWLKTARMPFSSTDRSASRGR